MLKNKFRAWCPRLVITKKCPSKMVYDGFAVEANGLGGCWIGTDVSSFDKDDVIMQYTGCKDKNGKEIYEGDICTYTDMVTEMKYMYIVKYKMCSGFCIGFTVRSPRDSEVIGNVYENQELLDENPFL